jgi:hypothetical protein
VPAGFIHRAGGKKIIEHIAAGETVEGYFQQTQIVEERINQNVFVETEEGDPRNVIISFVPARLNCRAT